MTADMEIAKEGVLPGDRAKDSNQFPERDLKEILLV
jgi:hypothetical protein